MRGGVHPAPPKGLSGTLGQESDPSRTDVERLTVYALRTGNRPAGRVPTGAKG